LLLGVLFLRRRKKKRGKEEEIFIIHSVSVM
jgi:hypothetical protein